jgi:hypothetical protein
VKAEFTCFENLSELWKAYSQVETRGMMKFHNILLGVLSAEVHPTIWKEAISEAMKQYQSRKENQ